jgi:hypothetical protein
MMLRQWELPKLLSIGISPAFGGILGLMPMHHEKRESKLSHSKTHFFNTP